MANVEITWQLGAGPLTNIDSIVVHKKQNANCAELQAEALAGSPPPIFTVLPSDFATTLSYTDTGVTTGDWGYGVFAKNSAGVHACHVNSSQTANVL